VIDLAKKKQCKLILAVNKVDVMPTHVSFNRIKYWVRMRIHELGVTLAAENIHLISSKNEYGIKKLASKGKL
jgi:hypothetical protein